MKAKIFVGPHETGKKGWAQLRAKEVGFENTVVIDGRSFRDNDPFVYHRINENTKLVIINDCREDFNYQFLFPVINGTDFKFQVNRRLEYPKEITVPELIVTTEFFDIEKSIGASFDHRFDIIVFSEKNNIEMFDDCEQHFNWDSFFNKISKPKMVISSNTTLK